MAARITLCFLWSAPWLIPTVVGALLLLPFRGLRVRLGNAVAKAIGYPVMFLLGIRPRVHNAQGLRAQRAIFVANHTSTLDLILASALCPFGGSGTAKKEILRVPVIGQAWWLTGHLLVDRGDSEKGRAAMRDMASAASKNRLSVWMFPEGTRSMDGRPAPFKRGCVHIACATGLPVVPVVIRGAAERWPPRTFRLSAGPVDVEVGDPIDTSDWTPETAGIHADTVHRMMVARLDGRADTTGPNDAVEA